MVPEQRPIDSSNSSPENETNEYAIPWLDKYVETLWWSQRPMSVDDMAVFRDIGRGAFGIVSGVVVVVVVFSKSSLINSFKGPISTDFLPAGK